ncbi:chemotaxis protein CheX [Pseudodesulfovibrio sp. zrk46]|uniref:chemotaxis protein CheX n=1 Tax=Pseudodesulfovibrio sp. zrk46 TaxID=2725288 RepID=UPI001448F315|nr:chemotaxis protein CheX [Pseudodesulfovibrio sp. zrk46]QJB57254.1 chemotaxis protein CheX [Pseudodesulfovibrio sp. zrk46]
MDKKINTLMTSLSKRAVEYLAEEMGLEAEKVEYHLKSIDQHTLKPLTSLVALSGGLGVYLAFSFDKPLIDTILERYTEEMTVTDEMVDKFIEVTAGDLLNLVAGNALAEVSDKGSPITITPPLFISGAKQIGRVDRAKIYMASLQFPEGNMDMICIGPPNLFDDKLEYKER